MHMRQYGLILVLLVGVLVLTFPSRVHANTLTVPSQYPTIQSAIIAANPGDTVQVAPGRYLERLTINKALHLIGASRDSTIIDGQSLGTVILVNSNNVEIRGFSVQNSEQFGWGIHV